MIFFISLCRSKWLSNVLFFHLWISCTTGLQGQRVESSQFLFILECLNFFSILKMVLIGVEFLVDSLFSFSVWKMSPHLFLVSMVFDKILTVIENSLYVINHSASFKILSLDSLTMIYLGMNLFEFIILGIHWDSWINNVFRQTSEAFNHYSFKYSVYPFLSF